MALFIRWERKVYGWYLPGLHPLSFEMGSVLFVSQSQIWWLCRQGPFRFDVRLDDLLQFQMMTDNLSRPIDVSRQQIGVDSDIGIWRGNKPDLLPDEKSLADLAYIGDPDLMYTSLIRIATHVSLFQYAVQETRQNYQWQAYNITTHCTTTSVQSCSSVSASGMRTW